MLSIARNLFGIQDVYLRVLLTRLTLVIKTCLFLKPLNVDKNRLAAFHAFKQRKQLLHFEKSTRVWLTLTHFLPLPTGGCCQPIVATFLTFCSKPTIIVVNHT
jgi:hypothetical protein